VKYTHKIQRKDFLDDEQVPIVSKEAEFTAAYPTFDTAQTIAAMLAKLGGERQKIEV